MNRPTEDDLIARFFAPIAGEGGLGLKDDAALIRPEAGTELVVSVDTVVAGVHFFADDPPSSIAAKALGVNLSDLAAKGAAPVGFVLALALPADWTVAWLEQFASGLGTVADDACCPLLGGDTVRTTGPLTLTITVFGSVPRGGMVPRTGAQVGDRLFASGTIGDSALGLLVRRGDASAQMLSERDKASLVDRYRIPRPRLALGASLRAHAHAAMDVSDGLVGDVAKMLKASGVSGVLDLRLVPLSPSARACVDLEPAMFATAMTGGDDYEILASVAVSASADFEAAAKLANVTVTAIGEVTAGTEAPLVLDTDGRRAAFAHLSFSHF